MKNSLIILLCFAAGVLCSYWGIIPECDDSLSLYILYVMMFLVGIGLGSDLTALSAPIKKYKFQILLIPLSTIVGTIAACCLFSLFCPVPLRETVAIGCGFGYYSLSAILLNELAGADIGTIALICNLSRELLTLLTIPLLARYCGKLAPITAAGATSIDTTLPLISHPRRKIRHLRHLSRHHRRYFGSRPHLAIIPMIAPDIQNRKGICQNDQNGAKINRIYPLCSPREL